MRKAKFVFNCPIFEGKNKTNFQHYQVVLLRLKLNNK